ncbi:MAG: alpha-1,2-fucosyltransferase [Terracidiphilus sp.]|jgi:hypothetical protein
MIVARLKGGLGNQMFQYACGFVLSLRKDTEFRFDASIYATDYATDDWLAKGHIKRNFELGVFSLTAYPLSGWKEFCVLTLLRRPFRPLRIILHLVGVPWALRYLSDTSHFRQVHPRFHDLGKNLYLDGHWQTEDYFKGYRAVIRREFAFRKPPDAQNSAMLSSIRSCNSVCVHVRRTDYTLPEFVASLGLCSVEYYRAAVAYMLRLFSDAQFFIFSDDPAWTAANLSYLASKTFVTHNVGRNDAEDLRLMMSCRHFIVANSTFSWWAAWLGNHPEKIVVAPEKWTATGEKNDAVPAEWVRVAS